MPSFFIVELHQSLWTPPYPTKAPALTPKGGWRMFARCADDNYRTCSLLFNDPNGFTCERTKREFLKFLTWLMNVGAQGVSWAQVFQDGKSFHPIHSFTVDRQAGGKTTKCQIDIFQFKKKKTDIRVLFIQSNIGRFNIFVTHAFEKDSQKTPASEQTRAESEARAFFAALDAGNVILLSDQGGSSATPKFI